MFAPLNRLRDLFKASKQCVRDRPPLKWAFRALYWSPLCIAFVHYGYTVKYVSGRSMQVRVKSIGFRLLAADALLVFGMISPLLTLTPLSGKIWSSSTASQPRYVTNTTEMMW